MKSQSSKLDEILEKLYEHDLVCRDLDCATNATSDHQPAWDIAKSEIKALIEEVGIKFLESCGEDDKIEAWKKYLKSGDQL